MKHVWEICPHLTRAVKASHDALPWQMLHCHDFDHVLRVGDLAYRIAEDDTTARLSGAAGLCHNADRILQKQLGLDRNGHVEDNLVVEMVSAWLATEPTGTYSEADRALIIDAVLHHGGPNKNDGSIVLATLQDADRVVNTDPDVLIRKGQYFGDDLRVIDPVHLCDDPKASFRDPRSILWTLGDEERCFMAESGVAALRNPKAREMAAENFTFYRQFIAETLRRREQAGLIPYPSFD